MKHIHLVFVLLALVMTGCGRRQRTELNELEQEAAATIQRLLVLHYDLDPKVVVTNVNQLFVLMDLGRPHRNHPYTLQQRFRSFGTHAGFKDSIYEKYIVFQPKLTNRSLKGPLVLMSAQPFPGLDGKLCRLTMWQAGKQDYRTEWLTETGVQQMFAEVGLSIPKLAPMPSPVPPPGDYTPNYTVAGRVRMFFEELAYHYGPGRFFWLPMMLISIGVILAALTLVFLWFSRRRRRRGGGLEP